MKKLFYILILISFFTNSYGQFYDLIVTTERDSIACRIDSITDTHVYFEMKFNSNWIHTNLNIEKIIEYKMNEIDKKEVVFKQGSSYFESRKSYNITKNAIVISNDFLLSVTLGYEKIIHVNNKTKISMRANAGWGFLDNYPVIIGEISLLKGKSKHFFETGIGTHENLNGNSPPIIVTIGYRLMDNKRILLKVRPQIWIETDGDSDFGTVFPLAGISLVYRFVEW